ncbi:MAG TPA: hypothetical protein VHW26_02070, partial [Solirubrobacteraceae bacterium]|nr:hypothetical protein [Solirubrobacteraceae bacterium]
AGAGPAGAGPAFGAGAAGVGQAPMTRLLALEVGAGQAGAVGDLMRAAGFAGIETRRDLAGIERVVVGRR